MKCKGNGRGSDIIEALYRRALEKIMAEILHETRQIFIPQYHDYKYDPIVIIMIMA